MSRGVRHLLLAAGALVWASPLYFVLVNASRPVGTWGDAPVWQPGASFALFANAADAWRQAQLGPSVTSTFLYASVGSALAVLLAALAAFGIAVLRIRRGFLWFMVLYVGTILPLQVFLAPLYEMYQGYGLYDSRAGLLVLYVAIAIPFAVFVIRNFFGGVPDALHEAARVDGASSWRIFWRIHVPLSRSALATVFIFQFTWIWNDLLFGLTLSRSADIRPIMTALASLQGVTSSASLSVVLAGTVLVATPMALLFLTIQRLFAQGLTLEADR